MSLATRKEVHNELPALPVGGVWLPLIILVLGVALSLLWGPSTAALHPLFSLPLFICSLFAFLWIFVDLIESPDRGLDVIMESKGFDFKSFSISCIAIGAVIFTGISWSYTAYHKQNSLFNNESLISLASKYHGKIAISTGQVAIEKSDSYFTDEGQVAMFNKYGRQVEIKNSHLRSFNTATFEHEILDKYFDNQARAKLKTNKETCAKLESGTICVERRASGQYYTGVFTLSKN